MTVKDKQVFDEVFRILKEIVLDESVTSYSIAKKAGLTEPQIRRYRMNPDSLSNMKLKTLEKILEKGR